MEESFHLHSRAPIRTYIDVLGDSPWDCFLKNIAFDVGLTEAEKTCFSIRFCEAHQSLFQAKAKPIEQLIETLDPTLGLQNYKKQFGKIYDKVGRHLGYDFKSVNRKDPELSEALKQAFEQWNGCQLASSPITLDRQMAEALCCLDYNQQEDRFNDFLDDQTQIAAAFVVEVSYDLELLLQHWLVKRLSRYLLGGDPPKFIPITIPRHWRNQGLEPFWATLSSALNQTYSPALGESVIDGLCELCKTQTIVIALYGLPTWKQDAAATLLSDFWQPLVDRLAQPSPVPRRGRLVLFMTSDRPFSPALSAILQQHSTFLGALEQFTRADTQRWYRQDLVRQLQNRCIAESRTRNFETIKPEQTLSEDAYEALEQICAAFGFDSGLEPFREFWQLSGDLAA